MSKLKAGLHKQVSSIFSGVPMPKNDDTQQPSDAQPPKNPDYGPPSHLASKALKPHQPTHPLPEPTPQEQPKTYTIKETARQIPWQQTWEQFKNRFFAPRPGISTKRQITMATLIPLLFVIMIFIFVKALSKPSPAAAKPVASGSVNTNVVLGNETDWQIPEPYPQTLRDPMQFGSVATVGSTAGPIVKGIVYSKDSPSAVVGNQIVQEGDKVFGATVVKINRDSVEFEINGERRIQKVQR